MNTPETLREKAAQLVFVRLGSNFSPFRTAEEDADRVADFLEDYPVGGLIFFNGQWPATAETLARLQRTSRFPLLVGADIERGVGQEVAGATLFPHAMAFGRLGTEGAAQTEAAARVTAREARACGIHITFAPVADVNIDPRNPIIATRAFGDDPELVAEMVRAYVRGARDEGILTTVKHFPGHGRTASDSHTEMPVIEASREELDTVELVPFRAALAAGADLVMTAHAAYPALHDDQTPATASAPILKDLLREEMGFDGPVVTDSLLMEGVKATHDSPGEQAVALVEAGVDLLLDPDDPKAVIDGLVRGLGDGRLSERRLDEAVRRVWFLKEQLVERQGGAAFPTEAGGSPYTDEVGRPEHQHLAKQVARQAITVMDGTSDVLPLRKDIGDGLLVARMTPKEEATEAPLARALQDVFPGARYRSIGPAADEEVLRNLRDEATDAEVVVLALVVEPGAWQRFGLPSSHRRLVEELLAARPVIVVSLGTPHILEDFSQAAGRICTFSDVASAQKALAVALAGQDGLLETS